MSSTRRSPLARAACAAVFGVAGALALTGGVAEAGKPSGGAGGGGGGVDSGTLYFTHQGSVWTMEPDGSAKTPLPAAVASPWNGSPSRHLHGGHRWLLAQRQIAGESYPGTSIPRRELFAIRDDGAMTARLTTQDDLMVSVGARWSPDDATISWPAKRWVGGVADPSLIYTADVVFDVDGNVTGIAAQPAGPAITVSNASLHDWSPDGGRMVVNVDVTGTSGSLWIVDLASGDVDSLSTGAPATGPVWSPDGTLIAFAGSDGTIRTIEPDGSGERVIVMRPKVKGATNMNVGFISPEWSPLGTHLIYVRRELFARHDVWRVGADGSSATNLTSDLNTFTWADGSLAAPLGWR